MKIQQRVQPDRISRKARKLGAVVLLSLASGAAAACTRHEVPAAASTEVSAEPRVAATPGLARLAGDASIREVAERALPSVVSVSSTKLTKGPSMPFFGPFGGQPFGGGQAPSHRQQGLGSGVIVSAGGIVVTNNHVVDGAESVRVSTYDKREFDARVIGTDPESDLAVLELKGDTKGLPPLELADSTVLHLGDVVLAIGNPFGVGQTVTMGIVSAKGRANVGIVDYEDFIQTDAAINPGNSGGALVNMEGKLVGINTAILSRSGGYQGIGFAIPSNMVKSISDSLRKTGRVERAWLGVSIQDVDADLAQALKLGAPHGVLVSDIKAGTPAAKSGLRRGDVILKVDGRAVDSTGELRNTIAGGGVGKKVELLVQRDGKPQTLGVELGAMPKSTQAGGPSASPAAEGSSLGVRVRPLDDRAREQFGVPNGVTQGVVVVNVEPNSAAADAGLRPGDVVLEVNRAAVDSVDGFAELYRKATKPTLLLVSRGGSTLFVVVRR